MDSSAPLSADLDRALSGIDDAARLASAAADLVHTIAARLAACAADAEWRAPSARAFHLRIARCDADVAAIRGRLEDALAEIAIARQAAERDAELAAQLGWPAGSTAALP